MPSAGLQFHYGRLERVLKGIALRFKLLIALEHLLRLASVFFVFLLGSLFFQVGGEVYAYLPFFYYLMALSCLGAIILLAAWRLAYRLPLEHVAGALEQKLPHLKDDVTNSLSLFGQRHQPARADPTSAALIAAHLHQTADKISKIDPKDMVNYRRMLPQFRLLVPLLIAFVVVFALAPRLLNRSLASIFDPFSVLPDRKTVILVEPPPSLVLRGSPVVINASTAGYVPDRLNLRFWPQKGDPIHFDMMPQGNGRFSHLIASAQASFRYQAFSGRFHSPVYDLRVVDPPDIGKIKLTLIPPEYTGLQQEVKENGHIEALKGTVVNLEAWTTKAVSQAKLILDQSTQLPLAVDGSLLTGDLFVFYPGTYKLAVQDDLGFENPDPVNYRIQLIPDKYPTGEIISPEDEREVSANDVLRVVYSVSDDFGVAAIKLTYRRGSTERFIALKRPGNSRSAELAVFQWDLTTLALTPGDRVSYRLEVWDNDSVSGPKAGYSRMLTLRVRDERDRAVREVEQAQTIADALLDLLADQLEDIKDRRRLADDITRIMEMVDQNLEQMRTEKIERFDLEALKRNLATLHRRIEELPRETITQEMERLALLAEELVKKARMHEMEMVAREIRNRQKRLLETLRDQKEPLTAETLQDLLQEVDKLRDLITQVMEAMSKMAMQLPDDFINNPDISGLDFQDLFKDLEEIRQQLMAGDPAAALEAARRLLQNLTEMMAAMARAGAQAGMGAFDRLQSEMVHQAGELEKILEEQKKVLADTETVDDELKQAMNAETEKRLNQSMPRLQELMALIQDRLPSEQRDAVSEIQKLLQEGQIEKLTRFLESLQNQLADQTEIRKLAEELKTMARASIANRSEIMTDDKSQAFPDLFSRQENIKERTRKLGENLESLAQLFPGMDTEIINDLKQGATSMGTASGKLEGEDAAGAIPPEESAIRSLSRSQQAMQQMAQQMARQMAMRMQANRWAYPWGYDPRSGWYYGPRVPMPTLPQPEVRRPRERGYTGIDREEFDPPSKDDYKAPPIFREKILEALKDDIPPRYRREVESYFKGLTE
ncbi:MAG: DUF4175 family protein [Deltaproteobacteria bacterium]|jgi:cytochrome c556|nr:DUF4175 family protein [Deltaproteobacteria bacterium]